MAIGADERAMPHAAAAGTCSTPRCRMLEPVVRNAAQRAKALALCACLLGACSREPEGSSAKHGAPADAGHAALTSDGGETRAAPQEPADAGAGSGAHTTVGRSHGPATDAGPLPESLPRVLDEDGGALAAGPAFVDVTEQAGLAYRQAPVHSSSGGSDWYSDNGLTGDAPFMTGGAAAGDFDGDGFVNLYVTRLDQPGILFRNRGDGSFEDVTHAAGLDLPGFRSVGAAWADVDNDGDLDLYVTTLGGGAFLLFINQGASFSEQAVARGAALADTQVRQGFSVSVGDYDRDGWLDLHTTEWQLGVTPKANPSHARLLHNRGAEGPALAGYFEDVTVAAGVVLDGPPASSNGPLSLSSSFSDLDGDGWPDLLVASDFGTSKLFWNRGDGSFADGTAAASVGTDQNGMGMAIGDYDGDGALDWLVTSIYCDKQTIDTVFCGGNRLYRNNGDRTFRDDSDRAGVRQGGWGWGAAFFDYDDDGDLDLAMTNGIRFHGSDFQPYVNDPTRLWRNDGSASPMLESSRALGLVDYSDGKGLLVLDYDNDGDLDLFIVNHVLGGRLYRNDRDNGNGYLRLRLQGTSANREGIGARVSVKVSPGSAPQVRELRGGSNFLGQDEPVLHFGLGPGSAPIDEVRIDWPTPGTRKVQLLTGVARNQTLTITEPE